ncbi:MAG: hypothetical protein FWB91_02055 [Defluviitaleaceae bacterium]|nr:hypothetical protein [Defluviitaleaceae bacterium]
MTTLIMHFTAGDLVFAEYTTLDINRQRDQFHINVTNDKADFAFNGVFSKIMELLDTDEAFSITVKQERGQAEFDRMAVSYHLTGQMEILNFSQINEK